MEKATTVTKKRFYGAPHDHLQMLEVAYYMAAKQRKPIRVYSDKDGIYKITSNLTQYISGDVYEVRPNGDSYYANGVNLPEKVKQDAAVKVAVKRTRAKKAPVDLETVTFTNPVTFNTEDLILAMDARSEHTSEEPGF